MTYIRYFATNRDRDNLARDVSLKDRKNMQSGGYNWIDARRYMAYYLAETNAQQMPKESLIINSEETVFQAFLSKPSIRRIIIGIHGFNVPLHGALTSFSILADTIRDLDAFKPPENRLNLIVDPLLPEEQYRLNTEDNLTAVVGFSWPANGSVLAYNSDRTEAVSSGPALANMISIIHKFNPAAEIFVIAHSMGNFLACNMLKQLVDREYVPYDYDKYDQGQLSLRGQNSGSDKFFIDGYFMLAPDVERRHVTKCYRSGEPTYQREQYSAQKENEMEDVYYLGPFFEGLLHLVGGVYLFYSRHDEALKASKVEKELRERADDLKELIVGRNINNLYEDSLGLNPAPPPAPPNMYSFNASTLSNMQIDHGNYFDTQGIAEKIAREIISYKSDG
ncbi:alpha/beta hydrolase [Nodosilinea nodulosa]|uniref:alpha/beta hydrolase n=1 Tax=Nodosilinea nodulosa TaxID=416001 RepID=UPI00031FF00D|nr:alpha/beta hydrolase [Nodosilinea nodulosa]